MITSNYKPICDLINKLVISNSPLSVTVINEMAFYKYVYHQIFNKSYYKMDSDFPQKLKTVNINAHVFQSASLKFRDAKIFQYRIYDSVTYKDSPFAELNIIIFSHPKSP